MKLTLPKLSIVWMGKKYWWKRLKAIRFRKDKRVEEAVENLIKSSRLTVSFFVMSGLSASLATLGILANDSVVLIAAMVLAPLMNPLLAFAAGASVQNNHLIFYSLKSFFGSFIFAIFISAFFIKILLLSEYMIDITAFQEKMETIGLFFYLVAFISGFAGVYTWLRSDNKVDFVGVAIAVSIIPIVSFLGILIGLGRYQEAFFLCVPFVINLLSISFGALIAFLLLGFSQHREEIGDEIDIIQRQDN
jgi:uncharacterized hydrophobic protein (TIGR00271 family)